MDKNKVAMIYNPETSTRKPMYENEMCQSVGLIATCNCCDRIIFEDENYKEQYIESHGYCKECNEEREQEEAQEALEAAIPETKTGFIVLEILGEGGSYQPVYCGDAGLMFFENQDAANLAIKECIDDVNKAVELGHMEEPYFEDDYKVVSATLTGTTIRCEVDGDTFIMDRTEDDYTQVTEIIAVTGDNVLDLIENRHVECLMLEQPLSTSKNVLFTNLGWVIEHENGKYSTMAGDETAYGTIAECFELLRTL